MRLPCRVVMETSLRWWASLTLLLSATANRALLWGTVLAVWTVAGVSVKAARTLGIKSVRDGGTVVFTPVAFDGGAYNPLHLPLGTQGG